LLGSARDRIADQHHVRRLVHTIKGNSGSWGIDSLSAQAHAIENREHISIEDLLSLEGVMRDFLEDNIELSWASYDVCEPAVDVSERELRELRRLIEYPSRLDEIEAWVLALLNRPARDFLGPIDALATKLSERLSKPVDLRIHGGDVGVDSEIVGPVLRDISHLVRNAIDHGIEASGERGHKPARGTVTLSIQRNPQGWTIEVEDDGRGIQTETLVERALELGVVMPSQVESMSEEERTALIFLDGVSTSMSTTDISGRGVGMSSVLDAVQKADGKLLTRSGPNGTKFSIEIPDNIERARSAIAPNPNRVLATD
jgi:two-component system chemotaxis sensor kinase CheA